MIELKPCPFCGGKAVIQQTDCGVFSSTAVRIGFRICCKRCDATASKSIGFLAANLMEDGSINIFIDDRETAIASWNRRAE